jgi:hypothetical protein
LRLVEEPVKSETEAYISLLTSHLNLMAGRMEEIPPDKWDWAPSIAAPTPRIIGEQTWRWLVADHRHLTEPDMTRHERTPAPPPTQKDVCAALREEGDRWRELIARLTASQMDEERYHFGAFPRNVRFMIGHITQQVTYKSGQLSTLYFALGLDGTEAFTAPVPNDDYDKLEAALAIPIFAAILKRDPAAASRALDDGVDLSAVGPTGHTPLKFAVLHDQSAIARMLLQAGADVDEADDYGCTLLMYCCFTARNKAAKALVSWDADTSRTNRWGITALDYARMEGNAALLDLLTEDESG